MSAILAALLLAAHIVFGVIGLSGYQSRVKSTVVEAVDLSGIPDGVYRGEHDVSYIYAKVEVTVKNHIITDIALLEHRNERGQPAGAVTGAILERQRVDVDAVSGATNSSTVIKKAVENALRSAL